MRRASSSWGLARQWEDIAWQTTLAKDNYKSSFVRNIPRITEANSYLISRSPIFQTHFPRRLFVAPNSPYNIRGSPRLNNEKILHF